MTVMNGKVRHEGAIRAPKGAPALPDAILLLVFEFCVLKILILGVAPCVLRLPS